MTDARPSELHDLRARVSEQVDVEEARLSSLKAEIALSEKRLAEMKQAASHLENLIKLYGAPVSSKPSRKLRKRTPMAWGQGTRTALDVLREAEKPMTVKELAEQTLIRSGVEIPEEVQIKALVGTLHGALKTQVEKGAVIRHGKRPAKFSSVPAN